MVSGYYLSLRIIFIFPLIFILFFIVYPTYFFFNGEAVLLACIFFLILRQKWVHTHILRLVLTHDQPLPKNIFMKNCNSSKAMRITSQDALIALNQTFSQLTTFPLVRNQSYIKFVGRLLVITL